MCFLIIKIVLLIVTTYIVVDIYNLMDGIKCSHEISTLIFNETNLVIEYGLVSKGSRILFSSKTTIDCLTIQSLHHQLCKEGEEDVNTTKCERLCKFYFHFCHTS